VGVAVGEVGCGAGVSVGAGVPPPVGDAAGVTVGDGVPLPLAAGDPVGVTCDPAGTRSPHDDNATAASPARAAPDPRHTVATRRLIATAARRRPWVKCAVAGRASPAP
jgi:hypothetical protein